MSYIYLMLGIAGVFLVLIIAGYSLLSYFLYSDKLESLDQKQKERCKEAINTGTNSSVLCNFYVKRGKCPNKKCEAFK